MTPLKIYIPFKAAEKLCMPESDGNVKTTVHTFPTKHSVCYRDVTWYNAHTNVPQLRPGEQSRDIIVRDGSHMKVEHVTTQITDQKTWPHFVNALAFDSWTYCDSLL